MNGPETGTDTPTRAERDQRQAAAGFVDSFAAAWDRPHPDRFLELLQPEIRLVDPLTPVSVGHDRAARTFRDVLRVLPGLRGAVHDWAPHAEGVFIHFTLSGRLRRRAVSWPAVDRFMLREGLATERVSYFDSLPLLVEALRAPTAWPRLLRAGVRPGAGSGTGPRAGGGVPVERGRPAAPGRSGDGVERFVAAYAALLAEPTVEGFIDLLDDAARVELPGLAPMPSRPAAREAVARLRTLLPDLEGRLLRSARGEHALFLESELSATVGRRLVRWRQIDHCELAGGRARRWTSFFDSAPHALALLASPRHRRRWKRARLLSLRRAGEPSAEPR